MQDLSGRRDFCGGFFIYSNLTCESDFRGPQVVYGVLRWDVEICIGFVTPSLVASHPCCQTYATPQPTDAPRPLPQLLPNATPPHPSLRPRLTNTPPPPSPRPPPPHPWPSFPTSLSPPQPTPPTPPPPPPFPDAHPPTPSL